MKLDRISLTSILIHGHQELVTKDSHSARHLLRWYNSRKLHSELFELANSAVWLIKRSTLMYKRYKLIVMIRSLHMKY